MNRKSVASGPSHRHRLLALDREFARIALLGVVLRDERVEALFARMRARRRAAGPLASYGHVVALAKDRDKLEEFSDELRPFLASERASDLRAVREELKTIGLDLPWLAVMVDSAFESWLVEADGRDWEDTAHEGDLLSVLREAFFLGAVDAIITCRGIESIMGVRTPPTLPPFLRDCGPGQRERFARTFAELVERGVDVTTGVASLARDLAPVPGDWCTVFLHARIAVVGEPTIASDAIDSPVRLLPGQTSAEVRQAYERAAEVALFGLGSSVRAFAPTPDQRERWYARAERDVGVWWRVTILGGPANSIRRVAADVFGNPERRGDVKRSIKRAQALLALGDSD